MAATITVLAEGMDDHGDDMMIMDMMLMEVKR